MFFQYLPRCNFDLKIHRLKEILNLKVQSKMRKIKKNRKGHFNNPLYLKCTA